MEEQTVNLLPKKSWYRQGWFIALIILLVIWFGPAWVLKIFYQNKSAADLTGLSSSNTNQATQLVDVYTADDPNIGSTQAPVVIVEFGDFECPYCLEVESAIKQILQKYPEAINFQFRDFPLTSIHPQALSAAQAANCAKSQGKFWEYHDALYRQQSELSAELYLTLAQNLSLDINNFKKCLTLPGTLYEMQEDIKAGLAAGVVGTPTFFVNGYKLEGPRDVNFWQQLIQQAIKAKFTQP